MATSLSAMCLTTHGRKAAWLLADRHRFGVNRKAVLTGALLAVIALLAPGPRWHLASVLAAGQQSSSFQVLGPMPGSIPGGT